MTTTKIDIDSVDVSKCLAVYNSSGYCAGPRYGMVYAIGGGNGYIAGYRSSANEGLGLMGRKHFVSLKAAKDFAVQSSDN
jgi:hypothetical protein